MSTTLFLFLVQAAEEEPLPSTIVQRVFLGFLIIFVVSVFATRFVARTVNISDATFGGAFMATIFKNMLSTGSFFFFGLAPGVPQALTLLISLALLPILVYKFVFSCETTQALLLWLGVLVIELVVAGGLSSAGIFDLKGLLGV